MTGIDFLILSLLWVAWCGLHSIMIARFMLELCETRFRSICNYHRLIFNLISIITFMAASVYTQTLPGIILYEFNGMPDILRIAVLIGSILLFIGGALGYDMFHFSGIQQILSKSTNRLLTKSGEFKKNGLLAITRHPWYLTALLMIWSSSSSISDVDLVTKSIFTAYLVIGTFMEERKMIWQFGEHYKKYQKEVSMLFPCKWLVRIVRKKS